ncbi:MAG: N-acetylmuramic acid 6-phosphate etherase [Verrucomicrobiaceae bacterium]|nr:N-acetylmuramic acid 6-phosphate etherase [Verrucomicrobiaceae bacterium]
MKSALPQPVELYLGIEGGGTRSTVVLADGKGRALVELSAGPANVRLLLDRQLLALFKSIAARLPQTDASLKAIAIGLAGARTEVDLERIRRAAARVWPGVLCHATDDLQTALAAAPVAKDVDARVLILSGTGSCCFGRSCNGLISKIGGRGHIIGDRGSACDIGQRALKALMAYYDREGTWPKLGAHVLRSLLFNDPEDLIAWSMEATKTDIAALAINVFAAARQRDPIALALLDEAAHSLTEDGLACAARLCEARQKVQFIFNGGVLLKNPAFAREVAARLRARWPNAVISKVASVSSWGAVALAMEAAGENEAPTRPLSAMGNAVAGLGSDHPAFDRALLQSSPTEQRNSRSMQLDTLPLAESIELMISEDQALPGALRAERDSILWVIRKIVAAFKRDGRLFYVGAGTSGRLGVLDASECPPTFSSPAEQVQGIIAGGQRALWSAVEGAEDDPAAGADAINGRGVGKDDVVIGIAASGRTPYVWGALAQAGALGATTVLVCFNPGFKTLPRRKGKFLPHRIIAPDVGPEVLTGSTRLKSGTATKLLLNLFTTLSMVHSGKVISNLMVDLNPSNAKLRVRAIGIVQQLTGCDPDVAKGALEDSGWVVKAAWERLAKRDM